MSEFKSQTMRLDKDCFNGKTTVGPKYDRLKPDYDKISEEMY